jgi:translation initiation factor 3 subunit M
MAIYIPHGEGGDAGAAMQGAEWLQGIIQIQQGADAEKTFVDRFQELLNANSYDSAAIFDLFVDHSEDLFSLIPEQVVATTGQGKQEDRVKEVESFFALVLSMLISFEDSEDLKKSTERLCKLFASSIEQQPELRLRLLMCLYNTFNNPSMPFRYRVFKHIVDYAAKARLFDQILTYLDYLDSWISDWEGADDLTLDDKRTLFWDLSQYMRALGKRVDAFLYLKRYAELFQGVKDAELGNQKVQDATILLLKDAVSLPSVIQFDDILAFDTVKSCAKGKHANLIALCQLFLNGDVKDLDKFYKDKTKGAVFKDYEIDYEGAMAKMRLLTLATKVHGKSEITLKEVADSLEEDVEKVEPWVVRALSEGVIDGRIDQLNHKVLVKSAFQREFGKAEWAFLDSKLSQWTENLENVIKFIGEQKRLREGNANQ